MKLICMFLIGIFVPCSCVVVQAGTLIDTFTTDTGYKRELHILQCLNGAAAQISESYFAPEATPSTGYATTAGQTIIHNVATSYRRIHTITLFFNALIWLTLLRSEAKMANFFPLGIQLACTAGLNMIATEGYFPRENSWCLEWSSTNKTEMAVGEPNFWFIFVAALPAACSTGLFLGSATKRCLLQIISAELAR